MVMGEPAVSVAPAEGEVIVDVGVAVSVDVLATVRPATRVVGCTPMSASRLTVAWRIEASVGVPARSWVASSPHDHCTLPAPKTSAPLGARYSVRACVALPLP